MSDLNLPGGDDLATDGDLESTEERIAHEVGVEPPDDERSVARPTPPPPD